MKPLRVGIIGAGVITSTIHLPIITRRRDLFEVAGLYDLNFEAVNSLSERFGISTEKRFSDVTEMFNTARLDAVLILNSGSHGDLVKLALQADLEVFCEKPLAYTKRELNEIRDALKQSKNRLMIGYMKSYDPAVKRAAELITKEGRPKTVDILVLHSSGNSQLTTSELSVDIPKASEDLREEFNADAKKIQNEALGLLADQIGTFYTNVLCGSLIHELSVLRTLGLQITEIDWVDRWPKTTTTDSIIVLARTADGVRISLRWLYIEDYPEYQEEVLWVGEKSSHHLQFASPYFLRVPTVLTSITSESGGLQKSQFGSYFGSFESELEEFYKMVTTSKQRGNDLSAGESDLHVLQLIAKKIAYIEGLVIGGDLLG